MVISAGTAIALPGGQGALEIDLTNTGPAAVTITGFTFTVQADNDDVSFSQVTQAGTTAPYIFAGNSLDTALWPAFGLSGPNDITLFSSSSPPMISANDTAMDSVGTTLAMNQTVALGLILFSVSPTASEGTSIAVSFLTDLGSSNLAGPVDQSTGFAAAFPPDSYQSGSISVVPAPRRSLSRPASSCSPVWVGIPRWRAKAMA